MKLLCLISILTRETLDFYICFPRSLTKHRAAFLLLHAHAQFLHRHAQDMQETEFPIKLLKMSEQAFELAEPRTRSIRRDIPTDHARFEPQNFYPFL